MRKSTSGFTIVELLIVIVVIAILAAISIVAYNGVQDRARSSKITNDIKTISKAIDLARQSKQSNLITITGSSATGGSCWNKPNGTDLATLPDSDACIVRYVASMNAIGDASGVGGLSSLRDPWGRPYLIDENEYESSSYCGRDTIAVYKLPFTTGFGVYGTTPTNTIPFSGFTPCG